jgi:hypothetical protein
LAGDGRVLAAIVAYVAAAAAGAYALRRASRIAVGIDGVWVRDASRARFFSYRELEAAKASGADLDLVGGGRVLLRLQLHGDDAGRLDEVQARINGGIARATDPRTRGAELFVQAMPSRRVAEATGGPASYRVPSPSREQLWELVEAVDDGRRDADGRRRGARGSPRAVGESAAPRGRRPVRRAARAHRDRRAGRRGAGAGGGRRRRVRGLRASTMTGPATASLP